MRVDLYTKAVLTVIAGALVWLAVLQTNVATPVSAQAPNHVFIAGYVWDRVERPLGTGTEGLPVAVAGGSLGAGVATPGPAPARSSGPAVAPLVSTPAKPVTSGQRQQCAATTQRGTRCSRMASPGSTFCWQHGG